MRRDELRSMVEVSLAAAVAWLLSLYAFRWLPHGGSVSLSMLPIFFVAFRRGPRAGLLAGLILGVLKVMFGGYILHFAQLVLDYPVPFALLGLAGFFRHLPLIGVLVGALGRFVSHVVSGVVFWGSYAPEGMNVWLYSLGYNASYMVAETLIALVVVYLLRTRKELFAHDGLG